MTVAATPGVSVTEAGLAVTPVGNPEIPTATLPVNPLIAEAITLMVCPDAPAVSASVVGVAVREKSGAGANVDPPPPQPNNSKLNEKPQTTIEVFITKRTFAKVGRSLIRDEGAIFRLIDSD